MAILGQYVMLNPNLGALADYLELGGSKETRHTVLFCPVGVSQGGHACAHGLAKQFLCPLSCLTGLTSGVWEAELTKPDLGCAARLEPVRELPVCVFQGAGRGPGPLREPSFLAVAPAPAWR